MTRHAPRVPGPPPSNPPARGSSHPHSSLCKLGRAERPPLLSSTADSTPPSPLPLPSPPSPSPHPARHAYLHPAAHRLPPRPGRCGCHRRRHCTAHGPAGTLREGRLRAPREPPPPLPAAAARGNSCPPWQATAAAASQSERRGLCEAQVGEGGGMRRERGGVPRHRAARALSAPARLCRTLSRGSDAPPRQPRRAAATPSAAASRTASRRPPRAGSLGGWAAAGRGREACRQRALPRAGNPFASHPPSLAMILIERPVSRTLRESRGVGRTATATKLRSNSCIQNKSTLKFLQRKSILWTRAAPSSTRPRQ